MSLYLLHARRRRKLIQDLFGNTQGLKAAQSKRLHAIYRRRVSPHEIVSAQLARELSELSRDLARQVGVLIGRRGEIEWVIVGDAHRIELPDIGRGRAGPTRLRGLRLVHTHLKDEPLTRDDLVDLALLRLDAVAAVLARRDGLPGKVHYATLLPGGGGDGMWRAEWAESVHGLDFDAEASAEALEAELGRLAGARARAVGGRERAMLIGMAKRDRRAAEASLDELAELARTAGLVVVDRVLQSRPNVDPRYVIGRGKLQDVLLRSMQQFADLIVFDNDLTPSQAKHIAEATSLKILDRTQLILDIFAQRAQSADGKLQVELAQLKYMLPRLSARDDSLSRLTGGIGGRGPGETKLEVHRERARARVARLERQIGELSRERAVRRRQRSRGQLPVVSIVGYTNAGKSTLLNGLTNSDVLVEDKLFATLDPTSRRLRFPRDREVIVTDTVGFIRDLPKDLVAAFRATLEELEEADLLLHVVDVSDPEHESRIAAVDKILGTLGLRETPVLLVFNKADRVDPGAAVRIAQLHGGVAISALKRDGFDELLARAEKVLWTEQVRAGGDAGERVELV